MFPLRRLRPDPRYPALQSSCANGEQDKQPVRALAPLMPQPLRRELSNLTLHGTTALGQAARVAADLLGAPATSLAWLDKVSTHPLVKKSLADRVQPPKGASLVVSQERMYHVRNHSSSQHRLIGMYAMGEVMDGGLRVIGAKELRMIYASAFRVVPVGIL